MEAVKAAIAGSTVAMTPTIPDGMSRSAANSAMNGIAVPITPMIARSIHARAPIDVGKVHTGRTVIQNREANTNPHVAICTGR